MHIRMKQKELTEYSENKEHSMYLAIPMARECASLLPPWFLHKPWHSPPSCRDNGIPTPHRSDRTWTPVEE